jgi:lysyl-tRNA synthetase class 2
VVGSSELGAEVWCRESDLTAPELGDEAIVDVVDISLVGRQKRNASQIVNRVAKNGYTAEIRRVGDVERGFSMALGRLGYASAAREAHPPVRQRAVPGLNLCIFTSSTCSQ